MGCNGKFMGRKFEVAPINFEMGFDFLAFFHINRIINNMFSNHHEDVVKVLTYTSSNFQLSLKLLWFIVSKIQTTADFDKSTPIVFAKLNDDLICDF